MADDLDIDLIAASLRADQGDLHTFVEGLAVKLEQTMPGRVHVDRRRAALFGPKYVQRITLDAADQRLELRASNGSIETFCSRLSGGIVLKRDQLGVDEWIATLSEIVAVEAQRSGNARRALERLLTR